MTGDDVYSELMFRRYLTTLNTVLTSATGYRALLQQSLGSTLAFFVVTLILLSFSSSLRFQVRQLPQLETFLSQTLQEIQTHFPVLFSAVWDEQTMNLMGVPLDVSYPSFVKPNDWHLPLYLARIEENEPSAEKLDQAQSLFFVSETQLYARNSQQQWVNFPLSSVLEGQTAFTLNQETLPTFLATLETQGRASLKFLLYVVYLMAPVWLVLSRLWEVLFNSLFLFFFLRLDNRAWPWKKVFQFGLYLAIPAEIIYQLSAWLYPSLNLPMFSLSFWVLALVVYFSPRLTLRSP